MDVIKRHRAAVGQIILQAPAGFGIAGLGAASFAAVALASASALASAFAFSSARRRVHFGRFGGVNLSGVHLRWVLRVDACRAADPFKPV